MAGHEADARQQGVRLAQDQERHAALLRTAYTLLADGDIAGLGALLAAEAVAHEYDGTCHYATWQGRDAILTRLYALAPHYWDAARVRVHTVAAAGPLTAAIATWWGASRATGLTYAVHHVVVVRVAGQHITEGWFIRATPLGDPAL